MSFEEPGLDEFGAPDAGDDLFDDNGNLAGMEGAVPADEDGFGYEGFEDGENPFWESQEKQDVGSVSNVPTSAPPTARGGAGMNLTSSTDLDWVKPNRPQRVAKPEHQGQWEANTNDHLNHARQLVRQAQVHHQENEKHIHASHKRHKDQSGKVQNSVRKKISQTNDLIKALEDRYESLEDTIRQVGECLFQLQRAHRSKWAPLNVCERRLELRDTRPLQELVRDHTQEALEHERQTLIESRQELSDQIQSCKDSLASLDTLKSAVLEDLSHKRHGQRLDRSCLNPATRPHLETHADRSVLPSLGEVSHYALPPSPTNRDNGCKEESRQVDTKALIQNVVRMEEGAMKLCNESDGVMLQTRRECTRAQQQAQASLARRGEETSDLKQKLEAQMREIDEAIADTQMSLGRTKKKLESNEIPLKTLDKQFDLRNKRTDREGIRDHVHEELETHLDHVKRSVKVLTQKFQNTKSLLDHLKESRQQLTEDYRCKLLALKIEEACLKVTPRKAIELDRTDPRGGRCKVASARGPPRNKGVYTLVSGAGGPSAGMDGDF